MSFAAALNALRKLFVVPVEVPPVAMIADLNVQMGIEGDGPLPKQAAALCAACGLPVNELPPMQSPRHSGAPPIPVAMGVAVGGSSVNTHQPASEPKAAASEPKAAGKRKAAVDIPPPLKAAKEQTLLDMPDICRLFVPKRQLEKKAEGGVRPYDELEMDAAFEVTKFESERETSTAKRPRYDCEECHRSFDTAIGLRNHMASHAVIGNQARICGLAEPKEPPRHHLTIAISLQAAAEATVSLSLSILVDGKSREQHQADVAALAEADAARQAEAARRKNDRCWQRERAQEAMLAEQRRGSSRRRSYSAKEKLAIHDVYESVRADGTRKAKKDFFEADSRSRGATWTTVYKWVRRDIERAAAQEHASTLLRINKHSQQVGRYAAMEKVLFARFKARRARARKCSAKWFVHTARHIMRSEYPEHADGFRGSRSWMRRFLKRWNLTQRKKTNVKNTTWEETKPVLQRYFRTTRRRLRDENWFAARAAVVASARALDSLSATITAVDDFEPPPPPPQVVTNPSGVDETLKARTKWGRYLPHQRLNVDQVPLPFIFEMDYTYEVKGAKRVAINQLGPSLSKRQCTAQVCFRPEPPPPPPPDASVEAQAAYRKHLMEQPPPCLVFRGTGTKISQRERDAYPAELVVLWQSKAWVDRPIAEEWAAKGLKPMIDADVAAGICNDASRYLLFQDTLDSQCQPKYLQILKEQCRTDDHKVPPNKTDQVQPIDRGLGRQIKIYMGDEEDAWLEDDENMRKWENNELTASDRRILLATWYVAAYKRALAGSTKRKYFEHAGALLTADGSGDDQIKLEGVPRGETFTWDDDEEADAETATPFAVDAEPDDVCPERAERLPPDGINDERIVDDEDDEDEDDVPPAPMEAPSGFRIVVEAPPAEQLAFSKEDVAAADALVGCSILFKWPAVGWCLGVIEERNTDACRYKMIESQREKVNFSIYYSIDEEVVATVLRANEYGGSEDGSWVLLEALAADP